MGAFINGIGTITAQQIETRLTNMQLHANSSLRLQCIEPDYKDLVPPMQLRRMSKVVRMGVASAKQALKDATISTPDIITIGTAYGCLADTEIFLKKLLTQDEAMLTPTSFIQSTHNTVSGQIALATQCYGHNFTYVHRGFSFETALQEALLWIDEHQSFNEFSVLAGGIDEMTNDSFDIISRFGTYKTNSQVTNSEGTIAGEGANMFLLSNKQNEQTYAECVDVHLCSSDNIQLELQTFLERTGLGTDDIDLCMIGTNSDSRYDQQIIEHISVLKNCGLLSFKNYCGEFPTSGAFAMVLASIILKNGFVPEQLQVMQASTKKESPKTILVYNHYKNKFHSFILLKRI